MKYTHKCYFCIRENGREKLYFEKTVPWNYKNNIVSTRTVLRIVSGIYIYIYIYNIKTEAML
jgi:hypothetical protein